MSLHNFHAGFITVPSELYRHLHHNYGSCRPESFIRSLWMKQMPPEVQVILAAFHDKSIEEITEVADAVMHVVETNPKKNDVAYRDLLLLQRIDTLSDKVERLSADVRWILKWKAAKDKESLEVKTFNSNSVLSPPVPETWRIRNQRSKCVVKPPAPETWHIKTQQSKSLLKSAPLGTWRTRSKARVRSASPTKMRYAGNPRKESLASVNTYNIQY